MGLILALAMTYIGGPLGLLFVLIGLVRIRRNKTPGEYGWPGLLLILGIILIVVAGLLAIEISKINFGL